MINFIIFINILILGYFIFSVTVYSLLLISSFAGIVRFFRMSKDTNISEFINKKHLPPMTVIIPVYNDSAQITNAVWSALKSTYPNLYVVVVNDGSTDDTLATLINTFSLEPIDLIIDEKIKTAPVKQAYCSKTHVNLMVIDKEHSNVSDSENVGVNVSFTPYIMTFDSDSIMAPEAVAQLMTYVVTNPHVIAVGGGVYLLNSCEYKNGVVTNPRFPRQLIPALQSNEYLRSHLFSRTAWNSFGGTMSYSGTATAFSRQAVLNVNGFDSPNFAQDAEIIIKLHEYYRRNKIPYTIGFNPAVTIWTVVPAKIKSYTIQQDHWRRGLLRSTLPYWYMFFNPRYKIQGLFAYPAFILLEMLGPIVEFTAYFTLSLAYYLGILNGWATLLYMILAWGFSSYLTLANAFINLITFNQYHRIQDVLKTFVLALVDMLGYRQYLTVVKIVSTIRYGINRLLGKPQ